MAAIGRCDAVAHSRSRYRGRPFDLEQMHEVAAAGSDSAKAGIPRAESRRLFALRRRHHQRQPLLYKGEYFRKTDVDQAPCDAARRP